MNIRNWNHKFDLSDYYGQEPFKSDKALPKDEVNDYSIHNRKIEINSRLKQSKFRSAVLRNYQSRCCISGIGKPDLLVASHIIPWAERISTRLDPANGLCLFVLYDKLFDLGYISLNDNLKVIVSKHAMDDERLRKQVKEIIGIKIRLPINHVPKREFLTFHRKYIFRKPSIRKL